MIVFLQFAGLALMSYFGFHLLRYLTLTTYTYATGRRTHSGRKRLSLVTEIRLITRMAHDQKEKYRHRSVMVDGKRVDASIYRPPLSPISTPMAREIASWHGLIPLHRPLDTKIGNYPLSFHRQGTAGRS
ncbi:hypothetical protein AFB00_10355 [Pseudonocardia sp. HH130630-07]|nr:hypothetical protein AFB00_10355 [Pseudonocardia sp. HH130630-07]